MSPPVWNVPRPWRSNRNLGVVKPGGPPRRRSHLRNRLLANPSRTDTFGLVMLEATASGVPVAAYPVEGPLDVIENGVNGWMDEDLRKAALQALEVDRAVCRRSAEPYSWDRCARQFLLHLQPV